MRAVTEPSVGEPRRVGTRLAAPAVMEIGIGEDGSARLSGFDVPEFAVQFCREAGALDALHTALRLAREHFPPALCAVFRIVPGYEASEK